MSYLRLDFLYTMHSNTKSFIKEQLVILADSNKTKWFSSQIDQQISMAVVTRGEEMIETNWLRNSPLLEAILDALCDHLGMCDKEYPYVSPYTEALAIALAYWRTKYGMMGSVVTETNIQQSWVQYVHELAQKLRPDILAERKAFSPRGKFADKVGALESQRSSSFRS